MQRLKASDAINPAWTFTQTLLWTPRRWRTLLKVGAVAVFAKMGGCSGNFTSPGHSGGNGPNFSHAGLLLLLLVAGVIGLLIGLGLFYLSSRLQLVLVAIMVWRDTRVAPLWRAYAGQTWRWIGLKLLFLLAALVCFAPFLVFLVLAILRFSRHGSTVPPEHLPGFILTVIFVILVFLVFVLLISAAYLLLTDFALPYLTIEDLGGREAVARVWAMVRAEPGQCALYLLIRVVLGFIGGMTAYVGILLAGLVLALPLGAAGYGLWTGLHAGGPGPRLLMIAGMCLLAILLLIPVIVASLMVFGFLLCFIQAYALFFLGGRYPALGQILLPEPVAPPPPPRWLPVAPPFSNYT